MNELCVIEGCNNIRRWSKRVGDIVYRGKLCDKHHRKFYGMKRGHQDNSEDRLKKLIRKLPCKVCGWDKANCDTHRIVNGKAGGEYKKDNVIALCPNCHRLVHLGKIDLHF